MALYSEPTSMMRTSSGMCVDSALHTSGRQQGKARAVKIQQPRRTDALRPGTCLRCGCTTPTAHATPNDCIDALRAALAEAWGGELRRTGRPSKSKGATEGATPMETGGNPGQFQASASR